MADRNVQMVGIIVGDRLPVERPLAERDSADRLQVLETIGRDLMLIGRHHLVDRRRSGFERDEQESAPGLQRNREEAHLLSLQSGIFVAMGDADQSPVSGITPRMIGAGQHFRTAACSVDQPRSAMPADVRESPDLAVVAANDDHALAEIFDRPPFAGLGDLALVADDLRRGAQERTLLRLEELGVVIEPAGQAHVLQRVGRGFDGAKVRGHDESITSATLPGEGIWRECSPAPPMPAFDPLRTLRMEQTLPPPIHQPPQRGQS